MGAFVKAYGGLYKFLSELASAFSAQRPFFIEKSPATKKAV